MYGWPICSFDPFRQVFYKSHIACVDCQLAKYKGVSFILRNLAVGSLQ